MARLEETVRWRDLSGGVITPVSSDIAVRNSIPFSMNLIYDKIIGQAVSRQGTDIIGSQLSAGNTCLGLYQHLDTDSTKNVLFAAFNGTIYPAAGSASNLTGLTASAKCRFTTFLNTTLMLNGVENRSFTSAGGWIDSGGVLNVGNVPAGGQFPCEFKDRVYCAVTDVLHYTNAASGGAVSWTATGSGTLPIEQEDGGGKIQGLNKVPGYLILYKQRSLKRWNFDSTFPEDLVNIGTQSNESIVRARGRNYFFYGPHGFFVTNGGFPQKISKPVQRFIDAIPASFYEHVNGWSDNEHIYWSVGDLTINFDRGYTETYNNVVLRHTIDTEEWAPLMYPFEFRFLTQYISSNAVLIAGGNTNGQVLQINTGNSDYGSLPIKYILQSPELDFGRREVLKTIADKIIVHSDNTYGAEIQRRLDYDEWKSFGKVRDIVTEVQIDTPMTAHVFEFRVVDSISGSQIKLRGLDFPNVDVLESFS